MDFSRFDDTVRKLEEEYTSYVITADKRVSSTVRRMLKYALESGDPMLIGHAYQAKAYSEYYINGNYKAFIKSLKLSARYLLRCSDTSEMKNVYYMIAIDALNKGIYDISYQYAILAKNVAIDAGQDDAALIVDGLIAVLLMRMGSYEEAFRYMVRSREGILEHPDHPMYHINIVIASINEGTARLKRGDISGARKRRAEAGEYADSCGQELDPDSMLDMYILGVKIALTDGDESEIISSLDLTIRKMEKVVQVLDHMADFDIIVKGLIERGYHEQARKLIDEISKYKIPDDVKSVKRVLSGMKIEYYRATGNAEELAKAYEEEERDLDRTHDKGSAEFAYIRELIRLTDEVQRDQEHIRREHERIKQRANTDALCGIPNRHALNTRLEKTYEEAFRSGTTIGVCILDVDGLKNYNDTYGHAAGDDCLRDIGKELSRALGAKELFPARYGGDEFVLLFTGRTDEEIYTYIEGLMKAMPLKASAGVCNAVPDSRHRSWDYLATADEALYEIKKTKKADGGGDVSGKPDICIREL